MRNISISWYLCHHTALSLQGIVARIQCLGVVWQTLRPRDPNRTISLSSVHKKFHHLTSVCSLANCNLFSTCVVLFCFVFFNNGTLWGLLANNLASHRRLLLVTVLTGNFRSSLITLELIIGWDFTILAIFWSIQMVVFHFLPCLCLVLVAILKHLSILTDQSIIFCTSSFPPLRSTF